MAEETQADRLRLGNAVRRARKAKGWEQEDLAAHAGVSKRTIGSLEAGRKVALSTLRDVSVALGWGDLGAEAVLQGLEPQKLERGMTLSSQTPEWWVEERDGLDAYLARQDQAKNAVLRAISEDPSLLPEAREHLIRQYGLLRRVDGGVPLPQQSQLAARDEKSTGRALRAAQDQEAESGDA